MARQVMNAEEIRRALTRISHEIVEKEGTADLIVVGIQRRGVPLARRSRVSAGALAGSFAFAGRSA